MWLNGRYISVPWSSWLHVSHGDYLRIVIPLRSDDCEVPTRRAAALALQGAQDARRGTGAQHDDIEDLMPSKRIRWESYEYEPEIADRDMVDFMRYQIFEGRQCRNDGVVQDWDPHVDDDDPTFGILGAAWPRSSPS